MPLLSRYSRRSPRSILTASRRRRHLARDDIDLPGDSGTGRLQRRVEVAIEFTRVNKIDGFTIKQAVLAERFPASLEIINADGTMQIYVSDIATFLNIEFDGEAIG